MTAPPPSPLVMLLQDLAARHGLQLQPAIREGERAVLPLAGDSRFEVWLLPVKEGESSFSRGQTFLLGYRNGEPGEAGIAFLRAATTRLRALEAVEGSLDLDSLAPPAAKPSAPDLIYGGDQLELRLTLACNERCVFCNSPDIAQNMAMSRDQALALLTEARTRGARRLVITGGEPLLVPWLPDISQQGRRLGYHPITIQSNGLLLADEPGLSRLREANPDDVLVSVHGPDDAVVSAITGVTGRFDDKIAGVENARRAGFRTAISFVVCRQNLDHIDATVLLLASLQPPPDLLAFSFVAPSGRAWDAGRQTIPRLREAAPRILSGLRLSRDLGLPALLVEYCGLPTCIEPGLREFAEPYDEEHPVGVPDDKTLLPRCVDCGWRPRCSGVFKRYLELYGDEEFEP